MKSSNNQPPQPKLFSLKQHVGNTTQLLLNIAKSMLRNGQKLFNSNVVLRRFVANDVNASKLRQKIKKTITPLDRDMEIAESIVTKCRSAPGASANRDAIEQLYMDFERLKKEAANYENERENLQKQLSNFIKQHPDNIQEMIDTMKE